MKFRTYVEPPEPMRGARRIEKALAMLRDQ